MGDLSDLGRDLFKTADNIPKNVNKIIRLIALAIDQQLVISTPVDTGRARSNWIVSTVDFPRLVRAPFAPGSGLGKGETQNAKAALDHGKSVIRSSKEGDAIYISNNVDYILDLNNGTSAQAPKFFIEAAILNGMKAGDRIKLL